MFVAPRSREYRGGFSYARTPVPLRLSAASNGLQFSHHFNGSFYAPPYYSDTPSPRPIGRPLKKQQTLPAVLTPIDPNKGAAAVSTSSPPPVVVPLRRTVSSLVPPDLPKLSIKQKAKNALSPDAARRPTKAANAAHRLSSSAASIHSTTSSFRSRKRKYYDVACLTSMPCEILDEVFSYLPQRDLHAVLLCNRYLADSVAPALYAAPRFASTYRFAQFVSVITHSPLLASLVRELELESVAEAVPEDLPVAGWRDWKYRTDPLHTIRREPDGFRLRKVGGGSSGGGSGKGRVKGTTHPLPSPFLTQYHTCRDVPMGGVLHIIVACSRLRKINLSNVAIADDYAVLPPASKHSGYRPTAFTNLLFVSDVPKSYTWRSDETKALHAAVELVNAVTKLRYLESFEARRGVWLTSGIASRLVSGCVRAVEWDFRECGGYKGERWARKGSSEEILDLLVESSP
ncbi:hypothetical protein Dda_7454 [Drechslerella dactyloides]|uniref:F-box domain-containing protein n=1 Tax=Drechslerella dactyloides TaxID=74499 RepID=A0AAD6IWH8_DREDA|nr:hypothetical protein Dda_7454 [Drechslerella dactyloides]